LFIVGNTLSNHPVDTYEAISTVYAIPSETGQPQAAALDNSYFASKNIREIETRAVDPFIATGREPHHKSWRERFAYCMMPVRL
jgi:hypothetical protein